MKLPNLKLNNKTHPMHFKKVLLIYKVPAYETQFLAKSKRRITPNDCFDVIHRLKNAYDCHYATLKIVESELLSRGIKYRKIRRQARMNFSGYDLIMTVGGDGTLLDAARQARSEVLLGVNSDPTRSVGNFCSADATTFPLMLDKISSGKAKIQSLNRLRISLRKAGIATDALNDILICHRHPAVMSHYVLCLGKQVEEQRSSGIWLSTAAGSTGAIHSAGGKVLPLTSHRLQYRPRELYDSFGRHYRLTGGSFPLAAMMRISSLMTDGICCIDGANLVLPFPFGEEMIISQSPNHLHLLFNSRR
jgi:NAD+ kinase